MYLLTADQLGKWVKTNNVVAPSSISVTCSKCSRNVALMKGSDSNCSSAHLVIYDCNWCGQRYQAFIPQPKDVEPNKGPIFLHPSPGPSRTEIAGPEDLGDEQLYAAYAEAVTAFNSGQWSAAGVLSGRALEGLLKKILREKAKGTLANMIKALPDHADFGKPFVELATELRNARNISAHYDLEIKPNQRTSEQMLDLLDYLLEFFFVLPERIGRLRDSIASDEGNDSGDTEESSVL